MLWRRAWADTQMRFWMGWSLLTLWGFYLAVLYRDFVAHGWRIVHLMATSPVVENHRWAPIQAATINLPYWFENETYLFLPVTLFAALIGAGGLPAQSGGRGALFTLSLPVTRDRVLLTRTAVGLAEVAALAFFVVLSVWTFAHPQPGFSLVKDSSGLWGFAQAPADPARLREFLDNGPRIAALALLGQLSVFGLATWLSTVFSDIWLPALLALLATWLVGWGGQWLYGALIPPPLAIAGARAAEPLWLSLTINVAIGLGALLAARQNLNRRDF